MMDTTRPLRGEGGMEAELGDSRPEGTAVGVAGSGANHNWRSLISADIQLLLKRQRRHFGRLPHWTLGVLDCCGIWDWRAREDR